MSEFFLEWIQKEPLRRPCTVLILLFRRNWLLRKVQIGLKQNAPRKMSASSLNLNYFVLILRWMCTALGTSCSAMARNASGEKLWLLKHNTNCQVQVTPSKMWKSSSDKKSLPPNIYHGTRKVPQPAYEGRVCRRFFRDTWGVKSGKLTPKRLQWL